MAKTKKWVPLERALRMPKKYGDLTRKFIDYRPDERRVFNATKQKLNTEFNLGWKPFLYDNRVYLISDKPTADKIIIDGSDQSISLLNQWAYSYSNNFWGMKAKALNREMYNVLPEHLKTQGKYLLASWDFYVHDGDYYECLQYIYNNNVIREPLAINGEPLTIVEGIRIVVNVPSNILVCVNNETFDGSDICKGLEVIRAGKGSVEMMSNEQLINEILKESDSNNKRLIELVEELKGRM